MNAPLALQTTAVQMLFVPILLAPTVALAKVDLVVMDTVAQTLMNASWEPIAAMRMLIAPT